MPGKAVTGFAKNESGEIFVVPAGQNVKSIGLQRPGAFPLIRASDILNEQTILGFCDLEQNVSFSSIIADDWQYQYCMHYKAARHG